MFHGLHSHMHRCEQQYDIASTWKQYPYTSFLCIHVHSTYTNSLLHCFTPTLAAEAHTGIFGTGSLPSSGHEHQNLLWPKPALILYAGSGHWVLVAKAWQCGRRWAITDWVRPSVIGHWHSTYMQVYICTHVWHSKSTCKTTFCKLPPFSSSTRSHSLMKIQHTIITLHTLQLDTWCD